MDGCDISVDVRRRIISQEGEGCFATLRNPDRATTQDDKLADENLTLQG